VIEHWIEVDNLEQADKIDYLQTSIKFARIMESALVASKGHEFDMSAEDMEEKLPLNVSEYSLRVMRGIAYGAYRELCSEGLQMEANKVIELCEPQADNIANDTGGFFTD